MPFPFFAHQAAVLPFKLRWPRWLSGTGLVLGSIGPDLGYFLLGNAVSRDWHRPDGVVLYVLPTAMVLYLLVTRVVAAPLARHLPAGGEFALRDLAYLEAQPRTLRHLLVVAASIVMGGGTHLAWDLFTHGGTWMAEYITWLDAVVLRIGDRPVLGTGLLWALSTIVGGTFSLLVLRAIGRGRLLRQWAEARQPGSTASIAADAPAATSHAAFWLPVRVVFLAAAVFAWLRRPPDFGPFDKATIVLVFLRSGALGFVTLLAVAWRERRAWRHPSSGSGAAAVSSPRAVDPAA